VPLIEVGHWMANESEDLSRPQSWIAQQRSPGFPDAVLAEIGAVVSEPSVRTSAMDVAPEFVSGLIYGRGALTAFCVQVMNYAQLALWLASTRSAMEGHDLLQLWSLAVSSGQVNRFKWTVPVDTAALPKPLSDEPAPARSRIRSSAHPIAIRDQDRQRRLRACCDIARRLQSLQQPSPLHGLVLVDNLTVVGGDKFHVAGLIPGHRHAGSNWTIIDCPVSAAPEDALTRFRNRISANVHSVRAARNGDADVRSGNPAEFSPVEASKGPVPRRQPAGSLMRANEFADLRAACEALAKAVDAALATGGADAERDIFEQPERLSSVVQTTTLSRSPSPILDAIARGLILARFPTVAAAAPAVFAKWLELVETLGVWPLALVLTTVAQPVYDHCRLRPRGTDLTFALRGLDLLIDRLLEEVERLPMPQPGDDIPADAWPDIDRMAVADVFDQLAELETTSGQRDRQLLRADAVVRLIAGLPTPDVIDRAVRSALAENAQVFFGLVARNHLSSPLMEIGAVAVADVKELTPDEGRKLFGDRFVASGGAGPAASATPSPLFASF
jgi:hypothetical protein